MCTQRRLQRQGIFGGPILLAAIVVALTSAPALADPPCDGVCFYASPTGTGTSCSFAVPCALNTGVAALDAAVPNTDLHLVLRGGTYALSAPLTLGAAHSGSATHRVFVESYPGETPVLSGGTTVSGWSLYDATKNIYRASVPADASARQLYVNGVRGQRARGYINADYQLVEATGYTLVGFPASWPNSVVTDMEFVALEHWKSLRCPVSSITPSGGTTAINIAPLCWADAKGSDENFTLGKADWMENAYEMIDEPGEWYLNRTSDWLYYKPRAGEDMSTASVVLPKVETLVRFVGGFNGPASNIVLKGLTFSHTNWTYADTGYIAGQAGVVACNPQYSTCPAGSKPPAAVSLEDALEVRVERCTFEHLGGSGIALSGPSWENEIEGNVLRDIASVGIIVGDILTEPPPPNDMTHNVVRNNFVTDTGRDYYDAVGILVLHARQTQVTHNEVRNVPYTGISVGWGWGLPETDDLAKENHIESNLGAHDMQRLWDGGQVYTLSIQTDSSIAQNYFHNSAGDTGEPGDFGGIYLDNGTQHYTVQSNVVTSTDYWLGIQTFVGLSHFAKNNVVQNNFADNSVVACCGQYGCCTDNPPNNNVLTNNQTFTPGTWPQGTWSILGQAGIEPAYADMRGTTTRVEAEDYNTDYAGGSGHYDTTSGNSFGQIYRWNGVNVDVSFCATCSNDHMVVAANTEWLRYYVDAVAGGVYSFTFRVSTNDASSSLQVDHGGYTAGTLSLPNTGGGWADFTLSGVLLPEGPNFLRLTFGGQPKLDFFTYSRSAVSCPGTPSQTLSGNFDGAAGTEQLRVFQSSLCWDLDTGGRPPVWMAGWGGGDLRVGDFNGDLRDDALVIFNDGSQWHWNLGLSTGYRLEKNPDALVGWGSGNQLLVGDYNGDGKDDAVVIFYDSATAVWRWHLAESTSSAFNAFPNAQVGYGNGNGACVKDYDSDGKDEIVVTWTPNICADLNVSAHTFTMTTPCSATCN